MKTQILQQLALLFRAAERPHPHLAMLGTPSPKIGRGGRGVRAIGGSLQTHVNTAVGAALAALLLLPACAEGPTEPRPIQALPRPLSSAEQATITASNQFAFDLFRQLEAEQPGENIFLSPLSASMALGMTMNGARGETFDAMRSTLGFAGLSQPEINAAYRSLIDLLRGLDPRVQMLLGNSIWYRDTFSFHPEFFDTTRTYFDAEVAGLDFADPASVNTINAWVKESTKGKIDTILEQIMDGDVMYLINAIYFKGDWTRQFPKQETRDAPFYDATGEQQIATVKMMHREGLILLARGDNFAAADLPYGGGAFSMTVILPDRGVEVDEVIASLTPEHWQTLTDSFEEADLELYLPRFRLEYEGSFNKALKALGMGIAFGEGGIPDFTGMSPHGRDLFISEVLQKTFVNVDEEGTEAAAVTKVTMRVTSGSSAFVVDRPFVFAIREKFSGTILFIGTMAEPPAEE